MEWLIILLLIVGGVISYRYLVRLEAEIRAEIAGSDLSETESTEAPALHPESPLQERIIEMINRHPGILQKELYRHFSDSDRKAIQKELLDLDRSGRISRRKSGNTYQLSSLD